PACNAARSRRDRARRRASRLSTALSRVLTASLTLDRLSERLDALLRTAGGVERLCEALTEEQIAELVLHLSREEARHREQIAARGAEARRQEARLDDPQLQAEILQTLLSQIPRHPERVAAAVAAMIPEAATEALRDHLVASGWTPPHE